MEQFIEQIKKNLEANGFPAKKVSLPTEKMYEIADDKGLSLNKVLEQLKSDHLIEAEIGTDKIVFSKAEDMAQGFPNVNPDMMSKVQEMMSQMDPEELKRVQDQVANMSEEDKQNMLKQAKDMGLF